MSLEGAANSKPHNFNRLSLERVSRSGSLETGVSEIASTSNINRQAK